MRRIIDHYLQGWKRLKDRKSLLVRGARQVGKTTSIRSLGDSFEEFVEINLELNPEYAEIFKPNLDPHRILKELRLLTGKRIVPGTSLLFIDEIQQEPLAVSALRYFYEKIPDLHVVAAGSLLEFALEQVGMPVGRVASLHMYPMSFLEFLVAGGETSLAEHLLDSQSSFRVSTPVHDKLLRLAGEYIVLGGLPEVVGSWLEHQDMNRCGELLDIIVTAYRQDFEKYAGRFQVKYVDLVFNEVPAMLGRKFKYSALPGTWKARELAPALELLCKASVVHKVTHSAGNGMPLKAESNPKKFKAICMDIGLSQRIMGADIRPWIMNLPRAVRNSGAIAEAFVGQELLAYGTPWTKQELFYWHREARSSNAEIDYLLPLDDAVIPVEVKSGTTGSLKSLRMFLDEKRDGSPYGIRFCAQPATIHEDLHSHAVYEIPHVVSRQIPRDWIG